jgi:hypothetical protein
MPSRDRACTASQTLTGSDFPFADTGSCSAYSIRSRVARQVASPTRTPLTGAADCNRAVVFTTSPDAIPSPASGRAPKEINASPVFTAMRSCRSASSSRTQSRMTSAARTARSGSSSCATGAPNSGTTASPMNFSTVPPKRSSSERRRWWYGASSARTSSGSICSAREVKPTRSANRTVTTLRSSRAAGSSNGLPQEKQNRAPAGLSCPQFGQRIRQI